MCAAVTPVGTSTEEFDPWLTSNKWQDLEQTFAFAESISYYGYNPELFGGNFTSFSGIAREATRDILADIASFTNMSLTELDGDGSAPKATFVFGATDGNFANENDFGAYAGLPSESEGGGD